MIPLFLGAKYGHHVRSWSHSGAGGPADLGHCFVALDPGCFAPGFGERLGESMQHWRQLEPVRVHRGWGRKKGPVRVVPEAGVGNSSR